MASPSPISPRLLRRIGSKIDQKLEERATRAELNSRLIHLVCSLDPDLLGSQAHRVLLALAINADRDSYADPTVFEISAQAGVAEVVDVDAALAWLTKVGFVLPEYIGGSVQGWWIRFDDDQEMFGGPEPLPIASAREMPSYPTPPILW